MIESESLLEKLEPASVAAQVSGRLRDAIVTGRLKPAERLVERRLAAAMGVSLSSIRDALRQLEHEGLVIRKANTATYVMNLSPAKLKEILDVRLFLEPPAAVQASRNLTSENGHALDALALEIERSVGSGEYYRLFRADLKFHQKIWQISGNETLAKMLTQLCHPLLAFGMIQLSQTGANLRERTHPHYALLDVLKLGNEDQIRNTFREHVLSNWRPYLERV